MQNFNKIIALYFDMEGVTKKDPTFKAKVAKLKDTYRKFSEEKLPEVLEDMLKLKTTFEHEICK